MYSGYNFPPFIPLLPLHDLFHSESPPFCLSLESKLVSKR